MPQGEGSDAAILTGLLGPFVAAGAPFLLFGGWAEELSGLRPPGPHGDIDLLLLAPRFAQLENLLTLSAGFREIRAKRFAHKRAWIGPSGVMVEFLLVTYDEAGPLTHFWGDLPFRWLQPLCDLAQGAVKVTSRDNLVRYRAHHRSLEPWRWRAAESLVA